MRQGAAVINLAVKCSSCRIRHRAVCSGCDVEELNALEQIKSYRSYNPGDTIASAGEDMPFVGSVVGGVANLSRTLADGRRQMVGLLLPSDFLGRPGRERIAYDVTAATNITFCMFQKPEFERIIARSPNIGGRLLEMTLDELDAAREWMLLLGRKTAREKIASLLISLSRREAALLQALPSDGQVFPLYLTREAIADYLGLTIETVSRHISAMRREGIIELDDPRHVRILDLEKLLDQSADDSDGGVIA